MRLTTLQSFLLTLQRPLDREDSYPIGLSAKVLTINLHMPFRKALVAEHSRVDYVVEMR